MVELQMAAEDAELEWEDERRQEKVRRLEAAYDAGMELVAAYGTIAELRRENAELSRVCERLVESRERVESCHATLAAIRAERAADEARKRVLWLRFFENLFMMRANGDDRCHQNPM